MDPRARLAPLVQERFDLITFIFSSRSLAYFLQKAMDVNHAKIDTVKLFIICKCNLVQACH